MLCNNDAANMLFLHDLFCFAGDHEIRVMMAGQEVPRSPFRVKVADPKQVVVDCPTHANLGNNAHVKGMIVRFCIK